MVILEALSQHGSVTSARNSEVLHAGLYYPSGSLKARLCREGHQRLQDFCDEAGVPYRLCGKLVVATEASQLPGLQALQAKAAANGVHDLRWLDREEAQALEPALRCEAALSVAKPPRSALWASVLVVDGRSTQPYRAARRSMPA